MITRLRERVRTGRFVVLVLIGLAACSSAAQPSTTSSASTASEASSTPADATQAGDIPDNQVYVAYQFVAGGYTVKVPEGWARRESGGVTTFTDKFNTVELASVTSSVAPTIATVTANEVPQLASTVSGFKLGGVTTVDRAAGTAVLITYHGDSPKDAVTGKVVTLAFERYELFKGGTTAVVTLSGGVNADNVDPWKTVTDSFAWSN
jgi:hypothetical protein